LQTVKALFRVIYFYFQGPSRTQVDLRFFRASFFMKEERQEHLELKEAQDEAHHAA
jgi:hypothetical protein